MIERGQFIELRLRGGFVIREIEFTAVPLRDALEREAIAQTRIVGKEFRLLMRSGLTDEEMSVTLYHEILEAASVASLHPPEAVLEFNEAAFERPAKEAHARWGNASPLNIDRLVQCHGFCEQ